MNKLISKGKDHLCKTAIAIASFAGCCYNTLCGDLFEAAETATGNFQTKMISLGKKIFPAALVVVIVSLFITHDERKLAMEIKILVALCVLFALMILVDRGVIVPTIEGLLG